MCCGCSNGYIVDVTDSSASISVEDHTDDATPAFTTTGESTSEIRTNPDISDESSCSTEVTVSSSDSSVSAEIDESMVTEITDIISKTGSESEAASASETEIEIGGYWPMIKYDSVYYVFGSISDGYYADVDKKNDPETILDDIWADISDLLDSFGMAEYVGNELNHIKQSEFADAGDLSVNDKSSTITFYDEYEFYLTDEGLLMVYVYDLERFESNPPSYIIIGRLWKPQ